MLVGCDIHAYLEVKEQGKWVYKEAELGYRKSIFPHEKFEDLELDLTQNYDMFSILAGGQKLC